MAEVVLDASAILAVLHSEPGAEQVAPLMEMALVSVINEAEVIGRLIGRGRSPEEAVKIVKALPYELVDLDRDLSRRAGAWSGVTKPQGLSLGDRCCLALAEREGLPALTADSSWSKITLGVEVRLIPGRGRRQ